MTVKFDYAGLPFGEDEAGKALLDRRFPSKLNTRFLTDVTLTPGAEKCVPANLPENLWGEVFDAKGLLIRNVNPGVVYNDLGEEKGISPFKASKQIEKAIFLGSMPSVWGHYITDGLSKAWFFDTEECSRLIKEGYVFLWTGLWGDASPNVPEHLARLYELLGVDRKLLIAVNEVTRVEQLCIPDNSLYNTPDGRLFTDEFTSVVKKLIDSVPEQDRKFPDKIFLSRARFKNSHAEFGENDISRLFKKAGFTIVYPEKLSVEEQIDLYRNAKQFVATEGSVAHNSIFCSAGTEVTIIRKAHYTNDYQYVINQIGDLDVTYVDSHLSVFTTNQPNMGPFFLYVDDNLVRLFKDRYGIEVRNSFSKLKFWNYVRIVLKKPDFYIRMQNPLPPYYYKKMVSELRRTRF